MPPCGMEPGIYRLFKLILMLLPHCVKDKNQIRLDWIEDIVRGFRMTTARRHRRRTASSVWILTAAAAVIVAVAVIGSRRPAPEARTPPVPTATPVAATPPPTATPTATPALELRFTTVVVTPPPTVSPTPTWPPPPPTRTPWSPSPTPGLSACVAVRFTTGQVLTPPPHVLVEIDAVNHCGRVVAAGDLWFEVRGWRDGSVAGSVVGHAFDPLYRGGSVQVAIGLPGSVDFFDRIGVRVLDGPP